MSALYRRRKEHVVMRKRYYTEKEFAEEAKRLANRRIIAVAVGGSVIALSAIAAVTYRAVKTMSEAKAWNDVDWNLEDDCTLL